MTRLRKPLLLLLVLSVTGCALPMLGEGGDGTPIHTYVLEWSPPGAPRTTATADAPSLLIAPPAANPGYAGSDMIYIREAHELHHFAYHRWADSPARMLEPLLLAAAEHSGLFRQVIPAGRQATAELRLDTRVLYLRQRVEADSCQTEFAVRIGLTRVASGQSLGGRLFDYKSPCTTPSPAGGVASANRLVGQFLEDLETALKGLLRP